MKKRKDVQGLYRIKQRLLSKERRELIIQTGVDIALQKGTLNIPITLIGKKLNMSHSLVHYHFSDTKAVHDGIMKKAIEEDISQLIVCGLLAKHPLALELPVERKRDAFKKAYCT